MIAEGLLKVLGAAEQGFRFARLASVRRGIGPRRDRYPPTYPSSLLSSVDSGVPRYPPVEKKCATGFAQ